MRTPHIRRGIAAAAAFGAVVLSACHDSTSSSNSQGMDKIQHVVVIYMENHSFDNLYGSFPGANGIAAAPAANTIQKDGTNTAYATLPMVGGSPFPNNLPNAPFALESYVPNTMELPDLVHRFFQEQVQIDSGKMDKFAYISDAEGESMGYYNTSDLPLAALAEQYTVCDNFFHSAFGGSFLNHQWLIAAQSPTYATAANDTGQAGTKLKPTFVTAGVVTDGQITKDLYLVNTVYSVNAPALNFGYSRPLIPNLTNSNIGDELTAKSVTWAWYAGGWDNALAGNADVNFQFHHQPFVYYANYADGTANKTKYLLDETKFITAAQNGTMPSVSFIKPIGEENEHPGYADIVAGENHVIQLINAIQSGPEWNSTAIIITYDENGGFWDHVAPPAIDRWGPGARVPAIIVSPYAKKGFVDHTQYETVSILAFIEKRFGVAALGTRDAAAADLENAFDFTQKVP